jgi:hypothetical protein
MSDYTHQGLGNASVAKRTTGTEAFTVQTFLMLVILAGSIFVPRRNLPIFD